MPQSRSLLICAAKRMSSTKTMKPTIVSVIIHQVCGGTCWSFSMVVAANSGMAVHNMERPGRLSSAKRVWAARTGGRLCDNEVTRTQITRFAPAAR